MIRHHCDQRALVNSFSPKCGQQLADSRIGVGNFAVVWSGGIAALERWRWIVGIVGVIEMHPHKKRATRMLVQPGQRVVDNFATPTLNGLITVFAARTQTKSRVVGIEATIKTGCSAIQWIEDQRAHKSRGVISLLTQKVGKIRKL